MHNKLKSLIPITLLIITILLSVSCYEPTKIIVVNDLEDRNIEYIFVSSSTEDVWGTNALPDWKVLLPGEKHEITVLADTYDIQVQDSRTDIYTIWDIEITDTDFTWNVTSEFMDEY